MQQSIKSEEHEGIIRNALRKATGEPGWNNIVPLTGGQSGGSIYKVETNKQCYVARFSYKNLWGNDLKAEYKHMQLASDAHVSPEVYYADPNAGIVLMKHIDAKAADQLTAENRHDVQSLAKLISCLHQCEEFSLGTSFLQLTQHIVLSLNKQYHKDKLVRQACDLVESFREILDDPNDFRSCHRDINPYNLLFDGNNYILIDWEAAAYDSLYIDLAICINYYFYDDPVAAGHFLQHYFGNELSEEQQHKCHLMRIVAFIYSGSVFLSQVAKSGRDLLSSEAINQLPSYVEYMKLIGSSKDLGDPLVQQEFGFILLKQALSLVLHPDYSNSFGQSAHFNI